MLHVEHDVVFLQKEKGRKGRDGKEREEGRKEEKRREEKRREEERLERSIQQNKSRCATSSYWQVASLLESLPHSFFAGSPRRASSVFAVTPSIAPASTFGCSAERTAHSARPRPRT